MSAKAAYAAGFFDGEGYIHVSKAGHLTVGITQIQEGPLEYMRGYYGGSIGSGGRCKGRRNPPRKWRAQGAEALCFLWHIRPYLILKADECNIAMDYPTGKRGLSVSEDMLAKRMEIREALIGIKKERNNG
jgi:hypothetical protein